jgi:hypothetical protein
VGGYALSGGVGDVPEEVVREVIVKEKNRLV